jgi:hypothetical protein
MKRRRTLVDVRSGRRVLPSQRGISDLNRQAKLPTTYQRRHTDPTPRAAQDLTRRERKIHVQVKQACLADPLDLRTGRAHFGLLVSRALSWVPSEHRERSIADLAPGQLVTS